MHSELLLEYFTFYVFSCFSREIITSSTCLDSSERRELG